MAIITSTFDVKTDFELKVDDLAKHDYEGAMRLCQETIAKISRAFEEYLTAVSKREQSLRALLNGTIENKCFINRGELEKDLAAIPKQRAYVEGWKGRYDCLSEKFSDLILFMSKHEKGEADNRQSELDTKARVFQDFKELNTFYSEYREVVDRIRSDLNLSMLFNLKSQGLPLNENIYTQDIADLHARFSAMRVIAELHFDMCCLHDLSGKVFSWVSPSASEPQ